MRAHVGALVPIWGPIRRLYLSERANNHASFQALATQFHLLSGNDAAGGENSAVYESRVSLSPAGSVAGPLNIGSRISTAAAAATHTHTYTIWALERASKAHFAPLKHQRG